MEKTVSQAVSSRHSMRYFDPTKQVNKADQAVILNAGLHAPNGFGVEAWKFIVIDGDRSELQKVAYGQAPITDCSFVVAALYVKSKYLERNPDFFISKLKKSGLNDEKIEQYLQMVMPNVDGNYFREQVPYATAQMVLQAEALGINSLIMGGFIEEEVAKLLGVDLEEYGIVTLTAFGYSKAEVDVNKERVIRDQLESIEFISL